MQMCAGLELIAVVPDTIVATCHEQGSILRAVCIIFCLEDNRLKPRRRDLANVMADLLAFKQRMRRPRVRPGGDSATVVRHLCDLATTSLQPRCEHATTIADGLRPGRSPVRPHGDHVATGGGPWRPFATPSPPHDHTGSILLAALF